jgi:hypothetical protein
VRVFLRLKGGRGAVAARPTTRGWSALRAPLLTRVTRARARPAGQHPGPAPPLAEAEGLSKLLNHMPTSTVRSGWPAHKWVGGGVGGRGSLGVNLMLLNLCQSLAHAHSFNLPFPSE